MAETYPNRPDLFAKVVWAAARGRLLAYSDLGTSRSMVGNYLFRLTHEEDAAGRPPLTAIVVHKEGGRLGRPGPGFAEAMRQIGYSRPGETPDESWRRAVADVYEYWRPKLDDERRAWPRLLVGSGDAT